MPSPKRAPLPPIDAVASNAVLIAVRQAAQVLCDRTVLLILLHAQLGACRYADLQARTGLASRLLSGRLGQLEQQGVIVRIPYSRRPLRHEYYLTHMGLALFDTFALAATWEQQAAPTTGGVSIDHIDCGGQGVVVEQRCAACAAPVHARDIALSVSRREIEHMPAKSMAMRRSTQGLHVARRDGAGPLPLAHVLEVLGDKWTIEIVVCAFLRAHLFSDFVARTGISTNILADRLQRLVAAGLMAHPHPQSDAALPNGAYLLTTSGRAFYPVLTAIQAWADTWLSGRIRSPVKLRHAPCGHALMPALACRHCGGAISRANGKLRLTHGAAAPVPAGPER